MGKIFPIQIKRTKEDTASVLLLALILGIEIGHNAPATLIYVTGLMLAANFVGYYRWVEERFE